MDEVSARGERQSAGAGCTDVRIIAVYGVRDHTGTQDLMPEDNPHLVPVWFARQLVAEGRARYAAEPARDVVAVIAADPVPVNADPRVRGARAARGVRGS